MRGIRRSASSGMEPLARRTSQHKETVRLSLIHSGLPPVTPVTIGFVRDAALWFYYEENFEALRRAGAELVELSLLSPEPWPGDRLDGLYLAADSPKWFLNASRIPRIWRKSGNTPCAVCPFMPSAGDSWSCARSCRSTGSSTP